MKVFIGCEKRMNWSTFHSDKLHGLNEIFKRK